MLPSEARFRCGEPESPSGLHSVPSVSGNSRFITLAGIAQPAGRQRFLKRLLLLAGIAIATALSSLALTLTAAQGILPATPTLPASPDAPTPEPSSSIVILPFGDTFETPDNWLAQGAWRFETDGGYAGGTWVLDGTQRNTLSTLQYVSPLDLYSPLGARLLFRQDGLLPPSDLISVEVSLDGGLTWAAVDQQFGIDSRWELRSVDLFKFRGQTIRLRLVVSSGAGSEQDDQRFVYRVDNLVAQFVSPAPEVVFSPAPIEPRTLMGLHLIVGAPKEGVLSLVTRLRDIGWPLGTLKGTSGTEDILNEVARISPETVIVFRSLLTPEGMVDCPDTHSDPAIEARRWITGLQPFWRQVSADFYEIMNECLPPAGWLVDFSIEAMRVAESYGQCLLLFSFSSGNPELAYFKELLPVVEYALNNPCQPGRYHGIALHAYGMSQHRLVSESGPWVGYRHRLLFMEMLTQFPDAGRIPFYLTEAGPGDGSTELGCDLVARDVIQFTRQLEYDPYIQGFHLWNLGAQAGWVDLSPCLAALQETLTAYYLTHSPAS